MGSWCVGFSIFFFLDMFSTFPGQGWARVHARAIVCMLVCSRVCTHKHAKIHMSHSTSVEVRGQTSESWFPPPVVWVPGIELGLPGLVAGTSTC